MHWEDILDQILIRECGHDPENPDGRVVDTGGLTRFGIAETSGMSKDEIEALTRETARAWYTANIWQKIKKCPPHLHYILADMWTNYGPRRAVKIVQETCNKNRAGLDVDGLLGPNSYRAMELVSVGQIRRTRFDWCENLAKNPKYSQYWEGWKDRILSV